MIDVKAEVNRIIAERKETAKTDKAGAMIQCIDDYCVLVGRVEAERDKLAEDIKYIYDVEERSHGAIGMAQRIIDIATNGRESGVMSGECEEAAQAVLKLRAERDEEKEIADEAYESGAKHRAGEIAANAKIAAMLDAACECCYDDVKAIAEDEG